MVPSYQLAEGSTSVRISLLPPTSSGDFPLTTMNLRSFEAPFVHSNKHPLALLEVHRTPQRKHGFRRYPQNFMKLEPDIGLRLSGV